MAERVVVRIEEDDRLLREWTSASFGMCDDADRAVVDGGRARRNQT
jgi:hypothetical protein